MSEAQRVGSWLKVVGVLLVIVTAVYGLTLGGRALEVARAAPVATVSGIPLQGSPDTLSYMLAFVVVPTFVAFILCLVLWGFGIIVQRSAD